MAGLDRRSFLLAPPALAIAEMANAVQPAPKAQASKFSLGLVTYNVPSAWDVDTLLKVCRTTGIGPVELRTTHKHGVEPSLTRDQRRTIKQKFADAGVGIWGCGTTCEFQSPNGDEVKKQIETCRRFVDLVADLGGKGVKVRPNALIPKEETATTLERIGKALVPCGQAAANAGVEIWVEVHGRGTAHPPHIKTMMEQCAHKSVGITWNSNPEDLVKGSVAEYFKLLQPWLKSCHINDLYKDADGVYPYRELFRLLREAGYDRTTLIEVGRTYADVGMGTEFLRYYKALWTELNRA